MLKYVSTGIEIVQNMIVCYRIIKLYILAIYRIYVRYFVWQE